MTMVDTSNEIWAKHNLLTMHGEPKSSQIDPRLCEQSQPENCIEVETVVNLQGEPKSWQIDPRLCEQFQPENSVELDTTFSLQRTPLPTEGKPRSTEGTPRPLALNLGPKTLLQSNMPRTPVISPSPTRRNSRRHVPASEVSPPLFVSPRTPPITPRRNSRRRARQGIPSRRRSSRNTTGI